MAHIIINNLEDCKKVCEWDTYIFQDAVNLLQKGPENLEKANQIQWRYQAEVDKKLAKDKAEKQKLLDAEEAKYQLKSTTKKIVVKKTWK